MNPTLSPHQYVDRRSGRVVTEALVADRTVSFLYNRLRETAPAMLAALTSSRVSSLLGFWRYDLPGRGFGRPQAVFERLGIDWRECLDPLDHYSTMRRIFERRIRYWDLRPMNPNPAAIACPADCRLLPGSLASTSSLFIKGKHFDLAELLGADSSWASRFAGGDFVICRLTPDKYHYNHLPVSGRVAAIYEVDGRYHSCNPLASVAVASIHSKNRRVVTIIDTDVDGGSQLGLVAMVEVVALMIGDIVQAYSSRRYDDPRPVVPGMQVEKGCPKSLYRPGSSTDIVVFEKDRVRFADDLVANCRRVDVQSRFTGDDGRPLVETDVRVRSTIAWRKENR
jgi:phosphatidylserine decarboxylase